MNAAVKFPSEMQFSANPNSEVAGHPANSPAKKRAKKNWRGKGDPRMHNAVSARMNHPNISLLDALLVGGFEFPEMGTPGITDKTCFDPERVSLYQRKNQLNRRLRSEKNKSSAPPSGAPRKASREQASSRCYADCVVSHVDIVPSSPRQEKREQEEADSFAAILTNILREAADEDIFVAEGLDVGKNSEESQIGPALVSPEEIIALHCDGNDTASWNDLLSPVSDFEF